MPDFSLKLPNLTAEISWSWRIRDSVDDIFAAVVVVVVLLLVMLVEEEGKWGKENEFVFSIKQSYKKV